MDITATSQIFLEALVESFVVFNIFTPILFLVFFSLLQAFLVSVTLDCSYTRIGTAVASDCWELVGVAGLPRALAVGKESEPAWPWASPSQTSCLHSLVPSENHFLSPIFVWQALRSALSYKQRKWA